MKRMIFLFAVGAAALSNVQAQNASPKLAQKTVAKSTLKRAPKPALKGAPGGFVPSKYAGVVVRSVPLKNPTQNSNGGAAFIYQKPGAPRPTRALRVTTRQAIKTGRGDSAKGGNYVTIPEHRLPMSVAHKDKNGTVTTE